MKAIDLAGQRFGKRIALRMVGVRGGHAQWLCRCDCGKESIIESSNLRRGMCVSCKSCAKTIHGHYGTRLYGIWKNMIKRCYVSSEVHYNRYGGRGIKICDEWGKNFLAFSLWSVVNGYSDSLTLDRINNDKDYCPENCRWTTKSQQQRNRCDTSYLKINGIRKPLREWAEGAGVPYQTVVNRIKYGWPTSRLFDPPDRHRKRVLYLWYRTKNYKLKDYEALEAKDASQNKP